jgi:hypothetical protein
LKGIATISIGLIGLTGFFLPSCIPSKSYPETHYSIRGLFAPDSSWIAADVQMVFVPRQTYHDSICFNLNPGLEIRSLSAQELHHYEFYRTDTGRLVLYIEEPVHPAEQLYISLSYSGGLGTGLSRELNQALFWYPVNPDVIPATFRIQLELPVQWQILEPSASPGRKGKHLYETHIPVHSLILDIGRTPSTHGKCGL